MVNRCSPSDCCPDRRHPAVDGLPFRSWKRAFGTELRLDSPEDDFCGEGGSDPYGDGCWPGVNVKTGQGYNLLLVASVYVKQVMYPS